MTEVLENKKLYVDFCGREFLRPYVERELPECEFVPSVEDAGVDYAVMLSSTDVYDVTEGEGYGEGTPLRHGSEPVAREEAFDAMCRRAGVRATILRLPHVVATGMDGYPRRIVNGILRGTFMHIEGNDSRLSVVHGVDVALAVRLTLGSGQELNVTDGEAPSLHDLAESLAFRLNQKRIFRLKPSWARWCMTKAARARHATTLTFSSEKIQKEFGFNPRLVTEYLRTHVYDNESL